MICDVEIPYGPRTLLVGDISETDESFDHAFGREHDVSYEVTDFRVFEFFAYKNAWVDTTEKIKALDPQQIEVLKSIFLLKAEARIRAQEESA